MISLVKLAHFVGNRRRVLLCGRRFGAEPRSSHLQGLLSLTPRSYPGRSSAARGRRPEAEPEKWGKGRDSGSSLHVSPPSVCSLIPVSGAHHNAVSPTNDRRPESLPGLEGLESLGAYAFAFHHPGGHRRE